MATLPLLESDHGDDPGTELRVRMSANSVYLNLSAESSHGVAMEDASFYRSIEPEEAHPILKQLPPPRKHAFLRVLFALFHGMGWRCCGLYWVNLLLIPLAIAGAICAMIELRHNVKHTLYIIMKYGGRKEFIGVAMEQGSMYLIYLLFCGNFLIWSVYVHRRMICGPEQAHFPAPLQRLKTFSVSSSTPASRREWFLRRYASTWMSGVILCLVLVDSSFMYWYTILPGLHRPISVVNQVSRVLSYAFQMWFFGAWGISIVVFYAVTDDVVHACRDFEQLITFGPCTHPPVQIGLDNSASPGQVEPRSVAVAKELRQLSDYVDSTLKPFKIWFIFHMAVCSLVGPIFLLGGVVTLLTGYPTVSDFTGYTGLMLAVQLIGYLVPLHAAARVTNTWSALVHRVITDDRLLSQCPVTYHSMALYVRKLGGGFRVFGWQVKHAAGLKFLTAILTVDGIIRLL